MPRRGAAGQAGRGDGRGVGGVLGESERASRGVDGGRVPAAGAADRGGQVLIPLAACRPWSIIQAPLGTRAERAPRPIVGARRRIHA